MSRRPKIGRCAICGSDGRLLTRDHIPARNPWGDDNPDDPIVVNSCSICNHGMGPDEEYFRDRITMRADVGDHPVANHVLEKVHRALARPERKSYLDDLWGGIRYRDFSTEGGIYLGKVATYNADLNILRRVVEKTVRGLHFHHFRRVVPVDYQLIVRTSEDLSTSAAADWIEKVLPKIVSGRERSVGGDVFRYWYATPGGMPTASVWVLMYYDRLPFIGLIGPNDPDTVDDPENDAPELVGLNKTSELR